MLIALTGKAQAGKDTAASALIGNLDFTPLAFAAALKDSCMFKFGLSHSDMHTQEGKAKYHSHWGLTSGEILQREGTEATKSFWGDDFWVRRWRLDYDAHMAQGLDKLVVTDCRFDEEAEAIRDLGGMVIHIIRPNGPKLEGRDPNHPSERGISPHLISHTIINDSSEKQLKLDIVAYVHEVANG